MNYRLIIGTSILTASIGYSGAFADTLYQMKNKLRQDQQKYQHDQETLIPINKQLETLNQQIEAEEKPQQEKYGILNKTLDSINKPYLDLIDKLTKEMHQADEIYADQIRQRDKDQQKVDQKVKVYRDQMEALRNKTWPERYAVYDDIAQIQKDQDTINQYIHKNNIQPDR